MKCNRQEVPESFKLFGVTPRWSPRRPSLWDGMWWPWLWEPDCLGEPVWQRLHRGGENQGVLRERVYEAPLSSKHFTRGGEGLPPQPQVERMAGGKGWERAAIHALAPGGKVVCLPPSPLPPFSHIKAWLFTLDVSKAGPCYPLLPDPFPEGPDYPSVHRPIQGGVHGVPGQGGPGPAPSTPHSTFFVYPMSQGDTVPWASEGWWWLLKSGCPSSCCRLWAPWDKGHQPGGSPGCCCSTQVPWGSLVVPAMVVLAEPALGPGDKEGHLTVPPSS